MEQGGGLRHERLITQTLVFNLSLTKSIVEMAASNDGQEGIRAFVEKRKSVFTGN